MSNCNQGLGPDRVTLTTEPTKTKTKAWPKTKAKSTLYPMSNITKDNMKDFVAWLNQPEHIAITAFIMLDSGLEVTCYANGSTAMRATTFFKTPLTKLRTKRI